MKILFIGLSPSKDLEKVLLTNGFKVESIKKIPSTLPRTDLVALYLKKESQIKELEKIRKILPHAWLTAIVEKKSLENTSFQNSLLNSTAKNAIWIHDFWEMNFWFSLQQMLDHQRLVTDLKKLKEENRVLKSHSEAMTLGSEKLLEQFERDVGLAENIQRSLLPKFSPEIPGISIAVKYIPAAGLGGDYYDIFEFGDRKRFGVLMADSKTHGMAAALLSVLLKLRLEEMKDRFPNSKSFVEHLNREIQAVHTKELKSLSLVYGILDRATLTFQYTSAGPLQPILWRMGKPAQIPLSTNPPLGEMDHYAFREQTLSLKPGDLLILHTDGLHAPLAQDGDHPFEKLVRVLEKKEPSPEAREVQNELMALIDRYCEKQTLSDDLTLIHLAIDEKALYVAQSK